MARRSATQPSAAQAVDSATTALDTSSPDSLTLLRRQWKWAAFCQFFFTFAALFNMPDVTIADLEQDLTNASAIVLPRIMVRLLLTLTQDRKINLDNWQVALRKQYARREPMNDPLAPLPEERTPSPEPSPSPLDAAITKAPEDRVKETSTRDSSVAARAQSTQDNATSPLDITAEEPPESDEGQRSSVDVEMSAKPEEDAQSPSEAVEDTRPQDWLDLPMLVKLDSMHALTEWQFHNVNRFRSTMRSDDEYASWRIEPIGYDTKSNAYWLIADNRLWIQRQPPAARSSRKRKRIPKAFASGRKSKRAAVHTSKRSDVRAVIASASTSRTRSTAQTTSTRPSAASRASSRQRSSPTTVGPRAAKLQANVKLGEQAKQLAALQNRASMEAKGRRPMGTRQSSRLRGSGADEDEWQQIPEDWLGDELGETAGTSKWRDGGMNRRSTRSRAMTSNAKGEAAIEVKASIGLDSDDESDLTELSDEDEEAISNSDQGSEDELSEELEVKVDPEDTDSEEAPPSLPDGFVEWETICVTLQEWDNIADRFKDSNHYLEKALFKALVNVVPVVTAQLKEAEKAKRLEEAIYTRKRSSRIAVKETQKEEARIAATKKAEEEKELGRARRAEARQKKEEMEREKREKAREQRRLDRETKEEQARLQTANSKEASAEVDVVSTSDGTTHPLATMGLPRPVHSAAGSGSSAARAHGCWELDCEVCSRRGINLDDGMAMIACIRCAKRQHIACHDTTDRNSGRPPRNWQRDPFVCGRCRAAAMPIRTNSNTTSRTAQPSVVKGYGNPYGQITLQIPRQGPNPTSLPSHVQPYSWGSMPQAPQGAQFMNTHSRSPHTQGSYPAAQQLPGVVSMHPQAQVSGRHNPTPLGTNGHLHPSPYPSNGQQQYHDTRTYPATPATQSPVQLYPPPVQPSYMSRDSQQQSNPYALDTRSSMTSMQGYGQVNNHHQGLYMTDPRGMGKPQGPFLGHDSQPASAPEMYAHMAAPPINGPPAVDINPHGQWPSSAAHQQYGRYPNFDSLAYGAPAQGRFPS